MVTTESGRSMRIALIAALALLPIAGAGGSVTGSVPVGTGDVLYPTVDHVRYVVPQGAVGLNNVTGEVRLAHVMSCPPLFQCTLDFECLAVFAVPGSIEVPYSFDWAFNNPQLRFTLIERRWTPVQTTPFEGCT